MKHFKMIGILISAAEIVLLAAMIFIFAPLVTNVGTAILLVATMIPAIIMVADTICGVRMECVWADETDCVLADERVKTRKEVANQATCDQDYDIPKITDWWAPLEAPQSDDAQTIKLILIAMFLAVKSQNMIAKSNRDHGFDS